MSDTFVPDPTFCCTGLQHRVTDAGQSGIAILIVDTPEGIRFRLQSRGIAFEDEPKLVPMPGAPDIRVNIACETGLQFCPFCGRRLQDLVNARPKAFADLAERHKKLLAIERS